MTAHEQRKRRIRDLGEGVRVIGTPEPDEVCPERIHAELRLLRSRVRRGKTFGQLRFVPGERRFSREAPHSVRQVPAVPLAEALAGFDTIDDGAPIHMHIAE